jgi:hypothetical protein
MGKRVAVVTFPPPSPHLTSPTATEVPTRQLGTEEKACLGTARTERCACVRDADASSRGNAGGRRRVGASGEMEMEPDAKNAERRG